MPKPMLRQPQTQQQTNTILSATQTQQQTQQTQQMDKMKLDYFASLALKNICRRCTSSMLVVTFIISIK
mgnify:CR=1 FL=1